MRASLMLAAFALLMLTAPAYAQLSPATLHEIGARPGPLARFPSGLYFTDEYGAPVVSSALLTGNAPTALLFVDYHCRNLCGVGLPLLIGAFEKTDASACRIAAISLNPRATPADAAAFRRAHFPHTPCRVRLLAGDAPAIAAATKALGYHYTRDPETGDFAHDAATYVLRPDGSVAGLVNEFALQDDTLVRALASAHRQDGVFNAAWRCICYALDPANGIYTGAVLGALQLTCGLMLALAGFGLWRLTRRMRHVA